MLPSVGESLWGNRILTEFQSVLPNISLINGKRVILQWRDVTDTILTECSRLTSPVVRYSKILKNSNEKKTKYQHCYSRGSDKVLFIDYIFLNFSNLCIIWKY